MDPKTGAGAYMISGGGNGGEINFDDPLSLLTGLMREKGDLWKYFGSFIKKVKQTFDFSVDSEKCGVGFLIAKLFAVLAITVGLTYLLMPYLILLGIGAASAYITVLRVLTIEVLLTGYFSTKFECGN